MAAIKQRSSNGIQRVIPVMFKGEAGWRCIGYVDAVSKAKDVQPDVEGLMIINHVWANKISVARIEEGQFIACHA